MSNIEHYIYPPTGTKHFGETIDSKNGFDVIECTTCGFKHVIPIPTPEELDKLYKEEFYSTEKPTYFKSTEEDLKWWELTYCNYYQLFDKYCTKKDRKLLEIGPGPGYFLKCGKELGWDVLGFEPSKQAYEYSKKLGVKVINKFFDKKSIKEYGEFNVIYMSTVIEHLPNPISIIKTAKKILKSNGIICIISPNDYNPLQNILRNNLGYKPWWVAPPQHINYFDFKSIKNLLERFNFEIVESTSTFPMEFFLLSGDNYVGNDKLGRKCHYKRKAFEINMCKYGNKHLSMIYRNLAKDGVGREFVVIGMKK